MIQPSLQIRFDVDDSPPAGLGHVGNDFDVAFNQIDVAPLKPLQFQRSNSRK